MTRKRPPPLPLYGSARGTKVSRPAVDRAADSAAIDERKVLLVLPPFWPPLIPPLGLATLKAHLRANGFPNVRANDMNAVDRLRIHQNRYLEQLRLHVSPERHGILPKISHDIILNHLLAYKDAEGDEEAIDPIIGLVISRTLYVPPRPEIVANLSRIVREFFVDLEATLEEMYDAERPDVLGVSVPDYSTLAPALTACEVLKRRRPDALTVMGGSIFLTGLAESPDFAPLLERARAIDAFIVGDARAALVDVLRSGPRGDRVHFKEPPESDVRPDLSDFNLRRYPYLGSEQTKSCPFSCGFCNIPRFHGAYRKLPGAQMAADLYALYREHRHQLIYMVDSLLNPVVRDLTDALAELPVPLYIDGFMRAQDALCSPSLAMRLRRNGLYRTRTGIESGSQRILDLMNKSSKVAQNTGTIRSLASAGIKTTCYLVVGYPGETEEDFQQTLDWIAELSDDIWQVDCTPFTYWYSGQCEDDAWAPHRRQLFPPLLGLQSWTLDCEPSREEAYHRVYRVSELCQSLGIPDPYDVQEHHRADRRWKDLHPNAVPPLTEFSLGHLIDECRTVRSPAQAVRAHDDGDLFQFGCTHE